ncbi:MAG TPA: cytochrome P450 [Chthoniobacterales bacterium]
MFDPFAQSYVDDPYPLFAAVRAATPVFYNAKLGYWVITRYEDVRSVLRNPKQFSAANSLDVPPVCPAAGQVLFEAGLNVIPTLTNTDPPHHTRVRRLTNQAFTSERVKGTEGYVREFTRRILTTRFRGGRADLVKDLTWELPPRIVHQLLGFPDQDTSFFQPGIDHPLQILWGRPTESEQVGVARGMAAFWTHTEQLVAARTQRPEDDFITALLEARAGDLEPLSPKEVSSIIFGILSAGHETTTSLLTHGFYRLLRDRDSWNRIRTDPTLIPNAVEEVLRIDPSVVAWRRVTTEGVNLAGATIPANAQVLLLLGSANRDPAVFEEPDVFDIDRQNARSQLAFGVGAHLCLGAPLARLEARIVFEEVSSHLPSLRLVPDQKMDFPPNLLFREPLSLLVEWDEVSSGAGS